MLALASCPEGKVTPLQGGDLVCPIFSTPQPPIPSLLSWNFWVVFLLLSTGEKRNKTLSTAQGGRLGAGLSLCADLLPSAKLHPHPCPVHPSFFPVSLEGAEGRKTMGGSYERSRGLRELGKLTLGPKEGEGSYYGYCFKVCYPNPQPLNPFSEVPLFRKLFLKITLTSFP